MSKCECCNYSVDKASKNPPTLCFKCWWNRRVNVECNHEVSLAEQISAEPRKSIYDPEAVDKMLARWASKGIPSTLAQQP